MMDFHIRSPGNMAAPAPSLAGPALSRLVTQGCAHADRKC